MHVSQFDGLTAAVEPGEEAIDPQFAAKWVKPPVAEALGDDAVGDAPHCPGALVAVVVTFVGGMME
jgi:hypothetical protein